MRKSGFLLLTILSFNGMFGFDIQHELDEINRLEKDLKSRYVFSWFVLGGASFIAAKFLGNKAAVLEKELNAQWFWNTETQQEELPAQADQTTGTLCYWGGKAATLTGCLSLFWGIKQHLHVLTIKRLIKTTQENIDAGRRRTESERFQNNDSGFSRWRRRNPFGTYNNYLAEETMNQFLEAADPGFRQWRRANPGGSYYEYRLGSQQPAAPQQPLPDHYATLGVAPTATAGEIKKAYYKLVRQYHPDQNPGDPIAVAKTQEINNANDTLKDPDLKAEYDRMRQFS